MKAKKLKFHATKVTAEVDPDVQTLSFEVTAEGDPSVFLTIMNQERGSVRVSWGDGKKRSADRVHKVTSAKLEKEKFSLLLAVAEATTAEPYDGAELTFDPLDEELGPIVAEAFEELFPPAPPPKPAYAGPRRRGNPQLGLVAASRNEWRVAIGADTPLELVVSNVGGGADGLTLEIGGPAIASGHVEVREAKIQSATAKLDVGKTAVRAPFEKVKVEADADVDRKALGKEAPPPPKFSVTVVVRGKSAGQGLLTVRATPRTADGRGGAMVGRTIIVE